jgi:putative Mn2+ efflux pump MntP
MGLLETVILGAGLSMDSFALSVTNGMCAVKNRLLAGLMSALCFGLFQGSLTTIGYALGSAFADKIRAVDHLIALFLLVYIGVKMLVDSRKQTSQRAVLSPAVVFVSAFATSVDALTVGIGLAALSVNIVFVGLVMTLVSAAICFAGFLIGDKAGKRLGSSARAVGGLVLIALGIKIFIQHMFM